MCVDQEVLETIRKAFEAGMVETQLKVSSEQGLHGRPADIFVRMTNKFECEITIRNLTTGSDMVNAKSLLKVLSLGIYRDHEIHIVAQGSGEEEAMRSITQLVLSNFREISGSSIQII
jgi:phosphotransferase system HPr (HPr) family protein